MSSRAPHRSAAHATGSAALLAPPLVEACCDSVHTAREAQAYGAGRVELCGPGPGGTTPSLGLIARTRDELTVPLHVMIRPHTRDFLYDEDDLDVMRNDIIAARQLGVDGIVLGPLQSSGTLHTQQLAELVELARPLKVTFHRAFDQVNDQHTSLDLMLLLGVDYVLTSGAARTALEGAARLQVLQQRAGDRLTILGGGGIRGDHVRDLLAVAPLREVHARGTDPLIVRDLVNALVS
jgi:copper homeostasis protein